MRIHNRKPLLSIVCTVCAFVLSLPNTFGQEKTMYFADGYHGGVYGHYPMSTTKFISDQLEANPNWKICLEIEPETWDSVKVSTNEDYLRFAEFTKTDRVEYTNPTYSQPYFYNILGESVIRQFRYGIQKLNQHFPWMVHETYACEEPCFTSCLPMVLGQFGYKYAVIKCPDTCWGGYPSAFGGELVNWIGPDGSNILAVPRSECEGFEVGSVWQTTSWRYSPEYVNICLANGIRHPVGMCYQDAGWTGGPWGGNSGPHVFVTWTEYFEKVADRTLCTDWYFTQEDIRPGLTWGCQTLQNVARKVRTVENGVIQAEKLSTIAALGNGFIPDSDLFDEAWRTLLLSQHHDCWITPFTKEQSAKGWADKVDDWTESSMMVIEEINKKTAEANSKKGKRKNYHYARVINTAAESRKELVVIPLPDSFVGKKLVVKDGEGNRVDWAPDTSGIVINASVPSFGYSSYSIRKRNKEIEHSKSVIEDNVIENSFYKIVFNKEQGGTIRSLVTKADGYEYADADDSFSIGELRGFFYDEGCYLSSADKPAEIAVDKSTSGVSVATVKGLIGSTQFTETYTLKEGDRKIYISLKIEWKENHGIGKRREGDISRENEKSFYNSMYKLEYLFPSSLQSPELFKDAPFDVCASAIRDTEFDTWDQIKHNVILNWVDLYDKDSDRGLAIFSDHTTSYSIKPSHPFALTVQFSGSGLWRTDYIITEPTEMKFCMMPHNDMWDKALVDEENLRWREPLRVFTYRNVRMENKSLIKLDGYELSASYLTDDGLILRFYNPSSDDSPRNAKLGFQALSVHEIDLNEKPIMPVPCANGEFSVSIPRFGIKTYLIKTN